MFKEAESRPDKIDSTSNNAQARKKQQHRRRACDPPCILKTPSLAKHSDTHVPKPTSSAQNTRQTLFRQREQTSLCNVPIIAMAPLVTPSDVTDIMARVNENTMVFY